MSTVTEKITVKDSILNIYKSDPGLYSIPGTEIVKEEAAAFFSSAGIPDKKNEEYKYANADSAFKEVVPGEPAANFSADALRPFFIHEESIRIVLVNGKFLQAISAVPDHLQILPLEKAFEEKNEFLLKNFSSILNYKTDGLSALNTFLFKSGVFIQIPDGVKLDVPVHIINLYSGSGNHLISPRIFIHAGKNSKAEVIETWGSLNPLRFFRNQGTEIFCSENSEFSYSLIQESNTHAVEISNTVAQIETRARASFSALTLSCGFLRNNLDVILVGENSETKLNGFFIAKEKGLIDNHTLVDHRVPNCESNELYKGVIDDKATGVFNGKIFVRKDAQKTNAYQSSKNILLSEDATINTKPQLEIYADDVKCSHGSSTGKIDEEGLFYLRSRGIGEPAARKLLLHAFAADVTDRLENEALRNYILEKTESRLN